MTWLPEFRNPRTRGSRTLFEPKIPKLARRRISSTNVLLPEPLTPVTQSTCQEECGVNVLQIVPACPGPPTSHDRPGLTVAAAREEFATRYLASTVGVGQHRQGPDATSWPHAGARTQVEEPPVAARIVLGVVPTTITEPPSSAALESATARHCPADAGRCWPVQNASTPTSPFDLRTTESAELPPLKVLPLRFSVR
jgi:hypothetical protein